MVSHPAQALSVFLQSGPTRHYVRVDEDGHTAWQEAETTFGQGARHNPRPNAPRLTPSELADLLAGSLE